jgi:hypothetical protein
VAFELLLPIEETFINMEEQIPENSFDRFKLWFHNLRLPNGMQTAPNPPEDFAAACKFMAPAV